MQPRIYRPVKPYYVSQHFGANAPCVTDFGLPTQKVIMGNDSATCPIGYEKLYQKFGMPGHNGMDLAAGEQNIYAAMDGTVIEKQTVPARGLGLGILTDEQYDLGEFGEHYISLRYWHLKTFYVEVGDKVKAGQCIGVSDTTGYSSGNHLHFELQPMDKDAGGHPSPTYGGSHQDGSIIAGSINPEPWIIETYAEDVPKLISLYTVLGPLLQKLLDALKSK